MEAQENIENEKKYKNTILINCYQALVEPTIERVIASWSTNRDSTFSLSEQSPYNPLDSLGDVTTYTSFYPIAFSEGDTIDLSSGTIAWSNPSSAPIIVSNAFSLYHHNQYMQYYYSNTDSIYKYHFSDSYFPKWKGIKESND